VTRSILSYSYSGGRPDERLDLRFGGEEVGRPTAARILRAAERLRIHAAIVSRG